MTALRVISFLLLAIDSLGFLGLIVTFCSSLFQASAGGDAPIWIGLALLVGAAVAFGWTLRRGGRPGIACLPAVLGLPFALYGIAIGALVLGPRGHM